MLLKLIPHWLQTQFHCTNIPWCVYLLISWQTLGLVFVWGCNGWSCVKHSHTNHLVDEWTFPPWYMFRTGFSMPRGRYPSLWTRWPGFFKTELLARVTSTRHLYFGDEVMAQLHFKFLPVQACRHELDPYDPYQKPGCGGTWLQLQCLGGRDSWMTEDPWATSLINVTRDPVFKIKVGCN